MVPDFKQIFSTFRPNGEGNLSLQIAEPLLINGPEPDLEQMPRKVLALTEKLKDKFNTLESEK